jgi:hypothetical protein
MLPPATWRLGLIAAALSLTGGLFAAFVTLVLDLQAGATQQTQTAIVVLRGVLTIGVLLLVGRGLTRLALARGTPEAPKAVTAGMLVGGLAALGMSFGHLVVGQLVADVTVVAALVDATLWTAFTVVAVLWGTREAPERHVAHTPYG